jgi:hypothetical protein
MNVYEMVATMVSDGAILPVDVAAQLMNDGYDISSLTEALDGYSVEDFIDRYEEIYG